MEAQNKRSAAVWMATLIGGFVVLLIFLTFSVFNPAPKIKPELTFEQQSQAAKTLQEFTQVLTVATFLKSQSKNPASFDLVSAGYTSDKVVCIEYRGANSFNAVVPGYYSAIGQIGSRNLKDWGKRCATATSVTDYSRVKYVLK
jgi:hypothetical protein